MTILDRPFIINPSDMPPVDESFIVILTGNAVADTPWQKRVTEAVSRDQEAADEFKASVEADEITNAE